jgi:hypothetical protein
MKHSISCGVVLLVAVLSCVVLSPPAVASVFINEIHYDNDSADENEFIEVAGPAGQDLSGWSIELYNGTGGTMYDTFDLDDVIANQQNGYGTLFLDAPGIQNGPDGIALVDNSDGVVQFLSYEGTLTAADGSAVGLTSINIGVLETGSTLKTESLQLTGTGMDYDDFTWAGPIANTQGGINTGQSFVPIPGAVWLLGSGLGGLLGIRGRMKHRSSRQ